MITTIGRAAPAPPAPAAPSGGGAGAAAGGGGGSGDIIGGCVEGDGTAESSAARRSVERRPDGITMRGVGEGEGEGESCRDDEGAGESRVFATAETASAEGSFGVAARTAAAPSGPGSGVWRGASTGGRCEGAGLGRTDAAGVVALWQGAEGNEGCGGRASVGKGVPWSARGGGSAASTSSSCLPLPEAGGEPQRAMGGAAGEGVNGQSCCTDRGHGEAGGDGVAVGQHTTRAG